MSTMNYLPVSSFHNAVLRFRPEEAFSQPTFAGLEGNAELVDASIGDRPAKLSSAAQEELILSHMAVVRNVARRVQRTLPASVELDELIAAGMLGLVDAAARFEPAAGVQFGSYAQFRIRGAMLDSLRDLDWGPRELRRKGRSVEAAIATATRKLGRTPGDVEVASAMGLALSDYHVLLGELGGLEVGSLNVAYGEDSDEDMIAYVAGTPDDQPLFQCLRGEMKQRLAEAIDELPERERIVMTLSYMEELTLKEIGEVLGVGESRISQLRSSAVVRLRAALRDLGSVSC